MCIKSFITRFLITEGEPNPNPSNCYILAGGVIHPPKQNWLEKFLPGLSNFPGKEKKILQLRHK